MPAVEFPPSSAEWVFFVASVVILVGPLVVERLGLPGIVGVILGGLLVGPNVLGGQNVDVMALADVPVLAVVNAGRDFRRVVLALDDHDLSPSRSAERELAVAVASVAAGAAHGRALVVAPDGEAAQRIAGQLGDGADVAVDHGSRRNAVAAVASQDDLVLVPARPGRSPLHRGAADLASLPVGCSVGVPARPQTASALVTGTPTLVGSRRTA